MPTLFQNPTVRFLVILIISSSTLRLLPAEENKKEPDPTAGKTAIALNYCRASFYRIKKSGSKEVMFEEREKILNNLNLNGVGDEKVIKLYSSVLDEISQVEIAEQEREYFKNKHNYHSRQKIATNALALTPMSSLSSLAMLSERVPTAGGIIEMWKPKRPGSLESRQKTHGSCGFQINAVSGYVLGNWHRKKISPMSG